ncbi:MAG: IS1634 family transposase [Planctomycetota bacterium]|jgi:transposase
MFIRKKSTGSHTYLQIVEAVRQDGKVRQRVISTLGRLDHLQESGKLDGLLASGAKFAKHLSVIGDHKKGKLAEHGTKKIGPSMIFERLWKETGIRRCVQSQLENRRFQFDVEGAVFLTVMHRLMDSGSDRAAEKWRHNYKIPKRIEELDLHQLYRAMAWLGEKLPDEEQVGRTPFAPRCVKDLIEEEMFAVRRDLFTEVAIIFFDTTSIYFEGKGGQTLGKRGKSKDRRPDLPQMVVGLVIDGEGRPLCCELWPGNTTDVKTLIPIVDRLRNRFRVVDICVVADRGMISKTTLKELEERDLGYILGARMRKQNEVKYEVLGRGGRYKEVVPPRNKAKDPSPLKVKEVSVDDRRYVVCYNEEQARKDAADREAIIAALKEQLKRGDKSFVGNKGYRKFIKTPTDGFEIDWDKVKKEARYDGKWVLRTNTDMSTEDVARTYKMLLMVEQLFRTVKSILDTRPIWHKWDETIRGHVFCSFLALVMMRELQERMDAKGHVEAEWNDVLNDLDSVNETLVEASDGKHFVIRSEAKGWCGKTFQAVGVALPPTLRHVNLKEKNHW